MSFFVSAGLGRLGIAMTSLSLVWLVHEATGSFLQAGIVTGAFALCEAIVGPLLARLVDRYGQSKVLPAQVTVHLCLVVTLVLAARWAADVPVLVILAGGVGATIPQFGALSAARWSFLLRDTPSTLQRAFSLESIANGTVFLIGPVVVSILGASGLAVVSQLAAGGLIFVGGVSLALLVGTAPPTAAGRHTRARRARAFGQAVVALILMNLAIGAYFGSIQVSVTGFAVTAGQEGLAAVVFLVGSCAGLFGAFVYGRITFKGGPANRTVVLASIFAALTALLLLATNIPTLLPIVLVTELLVPPLLVNLSVLMERVADPNALTQAFTWANSASAAGAAVAASIAGALLDAHGRSGGFYVVIAGALLLAILAIVSRPAAMRALRERTGVE
ncbi:MFS transporter [Curtobacterium sp. RRHDQ66]|uniref:MFS transporter n=1 Tax=Curtobacterium guangdongense TaxID=3413380 RepID=UPI003BEFD505